MAVGIEERMVPHMENKKQDCKKIEELKRQYAGSEMSGEQVEQMKKRIEEAKMEKRNESRKMHTVRNIVAAAAAVAAVFVVLPNTSGSVAYAMGNLPVVGKLVEAVTFRNYQYDNGGHAADIKTPELTVKESDTEQMTDTEVQVQENLKKTTAEINAEIEKITDQIGIGVRGEQEGRRGLSGGRGQARSYQHDRRLLYVKADVLSGGRQRRGVGLLLYD